MNLTLKLKLQTNKDQEQQLLETVEVFNEACNYVSDIAWTEHTLGQINLHKLCYYDIRERFNLSSQMAIRVIGKVADSYKTDKKHFHQFRPHGAITYDQRIWKFKQADTINIKTLVDRIDIPFVFGEYRELDQRRVRGQADLVYQDGIFYFCICIDVPEPPETQPKDFLGVDLGIVNIACDSDGEAFAGNKVNSLRNRNARLRKKLQKKGTKSAKRLLKKRSKKELRFAKDTNHVISKKIVEKAKRTDSGIAIENLTGIRSRIRVKKANRRQHSNWSFFDLRQKIEYKAKLAGIPVIPVDPRYTSQMCSQCGHISKSNRPNQSTFSCKSCGFSCNADWNAGLNIRARAIVNLPYAVSDEAKAPKQLLLAASCGGG